MHALIPAAGFGTRFLPWSKAVPKELAPLGDRPVIHHVVEEAFEAGCDDVVIVLSAGKEAIRSYFEADAELEARLEATGKGAMLEPLRRLQAGIRFTYVYQESMKGLGDAVLCGAGAIVGAPFAVLLGDTVIAGESPLRAMRRALETEGVSSVAVQEVPAERATRYGVVGGCETAPGVFYLDTLVEKPPISELPVVRRLDGADTHLAVAARYLFTPEIFDHLRRTPPGLNNEIQLTDAMESLRREQGFRACQLKGRRLDIGDAEGLREAMGEKV